MTHAAPSLPARPFPTYNPAWVLEQMGFSPLAPAEPPASLIVRVLFMPSLDSEVAVTIEELDEGTRFTLASYLTSLCFQSTQTGRILSWMMGERPPSLWLRRGVVSLDDAAREALRVRVEAAKSEQIDDPQRYVRMDGMNIWSGQRDNSGDVHDFLETQAHSALPARNALYRFVCALAGAAFLDETTADLLSRVKRYLPGGL